jgi:hypothetical protein
MSASATSLSKTISYKANLLFVFFYFQNFLRDLLKEAKKINDVSEDKLIEYTDTMVTIEFIMTFISFLRFLSGTVHLLKPFISLQQPNAVHRVSLKKALKRES